MVGVGHKLERFRCDSWTVFHFLVFFFTTDDLIPTSLLRVRSADLDEA